MGITNCNGMRMWWDHISPHPAQNLHRFIRWFHNNLVGGWAGLGDFRADLGAICQKPRPFPFFASPSTVSLPSLPITSAFCLLLSHTPPHCFTPISSPTPKDFTPRCSFLCSSDAEGATAFLIYRHGGKNDDRVQLLVNLSEMIKHMGNWTRFLT